MSPSLDGLVISKHRLADGCVLAMLKCSVHADTGVRGLIMQLI